MRGLIVNIPAPLLNKLIRISTMKVKDIIYEAGKYWVRKVKYGHYEIYENTITHSVRRGTVHYSQDDDKARRRAIEECDRRGL